MSRNVLKVDRNRFSNQQPNHYRNLLANVEHLLIWDKFLRAKMLAFTRSSHRRCSLRKDVLRNFAKFTGNYPCQGLFFKVAGLRLTPAQVSLPVNFAKFSRTPFFQNTSGRLLLICSHSTKCLLPKCLLGLQFYKLYTSHSYRV